MSFSSYVILSTKVNDSINTILDMYYIGVLHLVSKQADSRPNHEA